MHSFVDPVTGRGFVEDFSVQFEHKWRWRDSAEECSWAWILFYIGLVVAWTTDFSSMPALGFLVGMGFLSAIATLMTAFANRFGAIQPQKAMAIKATSPMMFLRHQRSFEVYCKQRAKSAGV